MKTVRQDIRGKKTLRLVERSPGSYTGLAIENSKILETIEGEDPEDIWIQLQLLAGGRDDFVGYPGAINRFRVFFPDGFQSAYFEDKENAYKRAAVAQLHDTLPLKDAQSATDESAIKALRVFQSTNLLFSVEKAKLSDFLKSKQGSEFIRRIGAFTETPGPATLEAVNALLRPVGLNKWTIVSYLPAYWMPESFLFLKPSVTLEFAERIGHRIARIYKPEPDWETYTQLHDMAEEILSRTADLAPRDYIDVQSFIWTVMTYTNEDKLDQT